MGWGGESPCCGASRAPAAADSEATEGSNGSGSKACGAAASAGLHGAGESPGKTPAPARARARARALALALAAGSAPARAQAEAKRMRSRCPGWSPMTGWSYAQSTASCPSQDVAGRWSRSPARPCAIHCPHRETPRRHRSPASDCRVLPRQARQARPSHRGNSANATSRQQPARRRGQGFDAAAAAGPF
eukprot:COSAG03_NODE_610_length_6719_cov_12.568841_7_plen_190_part_00